MIRVKNIESVRCVVSLESIQKWGWFWTKGMGGRLAQKLYMAPKNRDWGSAAWLFDLGNFSVEIIAGVSRERTSPFCDFVTKHGDHCVQEVVLEVEDPDHSLERSPAFYAAALSRGIHLVNPEPRRPRGGMPEFPQNPWIKRIDHIAIALTPDMMREEMEWWQNLGGKLTTKIDDVMPKDVPSSMMLWCLDFGTFGVALIAGLDREKKSQVTIFTERHGAPRVQHVAYGVHDLEAFRSHLVTDLGGHMRGEILVRSDDFGRGIIKQVFGAGYVEDDPAEAGFPEFVERPDASKDEIQSITFSQRFGVGLYAQIEEARAKGDTKPLVDFSRMPKNWEPKEVSK